MRKSEYRPPNLGELELTDIKRQQAEIADQALITKKLEKARPNLLNFLRRKFNNNSNHTAFEMLSADMLAILDITGLPQKRAVEEMDKVVLSIPGMAKTEKGYSVGDAEIIKENFGQGAIKNKIWQIFDAEPQKNFTTKDIAARLEISVPAANDCIKELIKEDRVKAAQTVLSKTGARKMKIFYQRTDKK